MFASDMVWKKTINKYFYYLYGKYYEIVIKTLCTEKFLRDEFEDIILQYISMK